MRTESRASAPGHTLRIGLTREDWAGKASFAWIGNSHFRELSTQAVRFLHPDELDYYSTLRFEKRQRSYLLGRFAAKLAIRDYSESDVADTQWRVAAGVFNQPVVCPGSADPIGVSISHSASVACAIVFPERHPMAVDVEDAVEGNVDTMKTQLLPDEVARARRHCPEETLACTFLWTAKEALSKALRCGMTCPYELLATTDFRQETHGFVGRFQNFGQYQFQSWSRNKTVVSLVLPRKTTITMPYSELLR